MTAFSAVYSNDRLLPENSSAFFLYHTIGILALNRNSYCFAYSAKGNFPYRAIVNLALPVCVSVSNSIVYIPLGSLEISRWYF